MLSLSRPIYDEILDHAETGGDEEICGVLVGERRRRDVDGEGHDVVEQHIGDDEHAVVEAVHRTTNAAETPRTRYLIDPEEQLTIIESIEAAGREVVGFYHSHPRGPPVPSETDAERAAWPGYSYAICVPGERPYLGSWRWTGETFEREAVALRPE